MTSYGARTVAIALLLGARGLAAQTLPTRGGTMYHFPRWSPDGTMIVVVAMSGTTSKLVVIPASGGPPTVLPTGRIEPMAADWTADGRITFVGDSAATGSRAFVIDATGKNLGGFIRDSVTSATRDSTVLLFESVHGGTSEVFAMNRDRSSPRRLTTGFWAEQPSISPDGRTIVFEKRVDPNRMDQSEVVTMDLDGGHPTTIAAGTDPSWSPDGRLILFKAMDGAGELWVATVDPSTRTVRRLTKGVHPQWHPQGKWIVYMRDERSGGNVYVMDRSGAEGRCLTCSEAHTTPSARHDLSHRDRS